MFGKLLNDRESLIEKYELTFVKAYGRYPENEKVLEWPTSEIVTLIKALEITIENNAAFAADILSENS